MTDATVSIIVAVLSCIGTAGGAITGIIVSNRLSTYRIEQLEKKVDGINDNFKDFSTNINDVKERVIILEQSTKSAHHRLDDITQQLNIHERRDRK